MPQQRAITLYLQTLIFISLAIGIKGGVAPLNSSADTLCLEIPLGRSHVDREQWNKFLRDNLDPDFEPWRRRAPLAAADILKTLNMTLAAMNVPAVIQLGLIYNNALYWPNRPDPNGGEPTRQWASNFIMHFHRRLTAALSSGRLTLPNVLFVYNTDDNAPRFNAPRRGLPAPLLSLIKSVGLPGGDDMDVLVPQMFLLQTSVFHTPWHLKIDRAFFRGMGFCSGVWVGRYGYVDSCARLYLAHLSARDAAKGNGSALDVGLVERWKHRVEPGAGPEGPRVSITYDLPVLDRVPFSHHSRYKWLLHLEGITASSRLGQLFQTNSLVISQRSPYLEYFYRSLQPWQHYVPFWNATASDGTPLGMDDVYGTLDELRRMDREQPLELQQIVVEANKFALRFLSPHARLLYYREVFVRYKVLFPDMDSFLESYVGDLRRKGWNIP